MSMLKYHINNGLTSRIRTWAYGDWVSERRHTPRTKARQNGNQTKRLVALPPPTKLDSFWAASARALLGIKRTGRPGWDAEDMKMLNQFNRRLGY